jgi:hypothetical protein
MEWTDLDEAYLAIFGKHPDAVNVVPLRRYAAASQLTVRREATYDSGESRSSSAGQSHQT